MNLQHQKPPLSWALISVFFIVSAIAVSTGILFINRQSEGVLDGKKQELQAVADLKVGQIVRWWHEKISNALIIRDNQPLVNEINSFLTKVNNEKENKALLVWMNSVINTFDCSNVAIIDSNDRIILSVPQSDTISWSYKNPLIPTIYERTKILLTDLQRGPSGKSIFLDLVVPLSRTEGASVRKVGKILFRIDPAAVLYPLITSWPTSSKSSETLILERNEDSVVYLSDVRFLPSTALSYKRSVNEKDLLAALAVKGMDGISQGVDYRGIPVLGALKKIPGSSWIMVSKIDMEEINTLVEGRTIPVKLLILIVIVAFGAVIGWTIWHQRVRFYRNRYEGELEKLALRKHFDYILKYANDIILLMDTDLHIVEANDHAMDVYQYSRDELIGQDVRILRTVEEFSRLDDKLKILNETGSSKYETVHIRKDGTTFPVEISARLFEMEGVRYYQSIGRDITVRRQIEDNMNQLLERYNLATNSARLAVWDWDIVNDKLLWDDMVYQLFGVGREDFPPVFSSWLKILHPDDIEKATNEIEQAISGQKEYDTEFRVVHTDGSLRYIKAYGQVVKNEEGKPARMIGINYDITEQKNSEILLKERDFWLSESQRVGRIGSYIFNIETLTWSSSDVLDDIFGIGKDYDRSLDGWSNLVHPDFQEKMLDYVINYVIANKNLFDLEYKMIQQSTGNERWLYGKGELSFNADGEPVRMIGTIQDITERKNAELLLFETEQTYRGMVNTISEAIYIHKDDGVFIDVNEGAIIMYGYSREELLGKTPEFVSAPGKNNLNDISSIIKRVFLTGKKEQFEFWGQRKNGEVFLKDVVSNKGRYFGQDVVISTARDITERKNAEISIEKSNSLLLATLESTADGILVVDVNGKIVQVNQKFSEMWRIPESVLNLRDDEKALSFVRDQLKDPESFLNNVRFLYDRPESVSFDLLEFIDGRIFERYSQPQRINNEIIGRVWSFRDITQRKQAEDQLINAKEKAEESDRLKTAFLHNISHEIRTPMNAIVGFTALLDDPDLEAESRRQFIDIIYQSSNQLLSIISDIVDIANIEAGQTRINVKPVKINSILISIFDQFKITSGQQKLDFKLNTGLPDDDSEVLTDGVKLTQILSNLLNNAFKFTKTGEISVGYTLKNDHLEFYVKDTGIGISAEKQLKIFDRFYQVENSVSRQYSGTGLGLSISKAYIELMNGTIWVESHAGHGSTFYFTIPYTRAIVVGK
jgi:PAS domain S-box-containing protein